MQHGDAYEGSNGAERDRVETTQEFNDTRPGLDETLHEGAGCRKRTDTACKPIHRNPVPRVPPVPDGQNMLLAILYGDRYLRYRVGDEIIEIDKLSGRMKRLMWCGSYGYFLDPTDWHDSRWFEVREWQKSPTNEV